MEQPPLDNAELYDAHDKPVVNAPTDQAQADEPSSSSQAVGTAAPRRPRAVAPRHTWGPPWLTPISHRTQIDTFWLLIAMMMIAMGVIFFGWRGMLGVSAAWLATLATYLLVSLVMPWFETRRLPDSSMHVLTMGILMGLSLPVTRQPWVPITAGVVLGLLCHVMGRSHKLRISPLALALVGVWVMPNLISQHWHEHPRQMTTEPAVLVLDHLVLGDLYNAGSNQSAGHTWWEYSSPAGVHAQRRPEPMLVLLESQVHKRPENMGSLLSRGDLPRVEELLIGCVPGPIGATSKAVILIIGLVLINRRISWSNMALAGMGASLVMLLCLPVHSQNQWTLMAVCLWEMPWMHALVYMGYFILAGPLLWILLILGPISAPMSARGKIYYGCIIGAGTILAIWLTGQWAGGYVALLVASCFTRPLDALQKSPMLSLRV